MLLVDDEPSILKAFQRVVRREPYDLLTATSGDEAIRILEQRPVQLVICDQRMPMMTGTDLLRKVRRRWPETIRMVLSGYAEVTTIINAVNEGEIYKYLTKPWNDEEVKLGIREALEQFAPLRPERDTAARGELSLGERILEALSAGVLAVNSNGVVLAANGMARELFFAEANPIGNPVRAVASQDIVDVLFRDSALSRSRNSGRIQVDDREFQWRSQPLGAPEQNAGVVLTLWENLDSGE